MPAKIETEFQSGFILSEENLAKIDDIIRKRFQIPEIDLSILYKIHRVDDALITYEKYSEVTKEENSKRNGIKGLDITASIESNSIDLSFQKGRKTKLDISSDDRDLALLISADIKEYLNTEVLVKKLSPITRLARSNLFFPILMSISIAPMLISIILRDSPEQIDVVKSGIEDKINYLVQVENYRSSAQNKSYYVFSPFVLIFSGVIFTILSNWIYPNDIFLWGKESQRYEEQKSLRSKIFWGVIVAVIVGIISAYLYDFPGKRT